MKDEAMRLWGRGDLHQIIRKEILFGLVPKTLSGMRFNLTRVCSYYNSPKILVPDSPDQQHAIGNLINLLSHGSFLRNTNGLNSLPTFRKFAQILQKPNGLQFTTSEMSITSFIRSSTQRK